MATWTKHESIKLKVTHSQSSSSNAGTDVDAAASVKQPAGSHDIVVAALTLSTSLGITSSGGLIKFCLLSQTHNGPAMKMGNAGGHTQLGEWWPPAYTQNMPVSFIYASNSWLVGASGFFGDDSYRHWNITFITTQT